MSAAGARTKERSDAHRVFSPWDSLARSLSRPQADTTRAKRAGSYGWSSKIFSRRVPVKMNARWEA